MGGFRNFLSVPPTPALAPPTHCANGRTEGGRAEGTDPPTDGPGRPGTCSVSERGRLLFTVACDLTPPAGPHRPPAHPGPGCPLPTVPRREPSGVEGPPSHSAPHWAAQGLVPGYRGFHWCVRPSYTRELKEMHCSSRKLLPSGGHSCGASERAREREREREEAPGGTRPDKGIFVPAEQEVAAAGLGWPLVLPQSHSLSGRSRGQPTERAAAVPQTPTRPGPPGAPGRVLPRPRHPSLLPRGTGARKGRPASAVLALSPTRLRPRAEGGGLGVGGSRSRGGVGGSPSGGAHKRPAGEQTSDANTGAVAARLPSGPKSSSVHIPRDAHGDAKTPMACCLSTPHLFWVVAGGRGVQVQTGLAPLKGTQRLSQSQHLLSPLGSCSETSHGWGRDTW